MKSGMKSAVFLLLSLASMSSASARTSNVYDLMYIPEQGTFTGHSSFSSTSNTQKVEYIGRDVLTIDTKTTALSQEFSYTFMPELVVGVGIGYQIKSERETKYGTATTTPGVVLKSKSEKGMEEPTFFAKKRLATSDSASGRDIDIGLSFSPKIGNAKSSNTTKDGNALRGASEIAFQVEAGVKEETSAWNVVASYTHVTEATDEDASTKTNVTTTDAYGSLGFGFTYQWNINPSFLVNLNVGLTFIGEREQLNKTSALKNKIDSLSVVALGPVFIYNLSPKATVELSILGSGTSDYDFAQTNTNTQSRTTLTYTENTTGVVSLGTRYEF